MREHLYKAKRCDNDEWVEGYLVISNGTWHKFGVHKEWIVTSAYANGGWFCVCRRFAVKAETICEYIGRRDINKKRVFEGDCVRLVFEDDDPVQIEFGVVVWLKEFLKFTADVGENRLCRLEIPTIEVIGNIHDKEE